MLAIRSPRAVPESLDYERTGEVALSMSEVVCMTDVWAMAVRRELGGGYLAGLVRFLVIWQSGGLKGWAAVDPAVDPVAGQGSP